MRTARVRRRESGGAVVESVEGEDTNCRRLRAKNTHQRHRPSRPERNSHFLGNSLFECDQANPKALDASYEKALSSFRRSTCSALIGRDIPSLGVGVP